MASSKPLTCPGTTAGAHWTALPIEYRSPGDSSVIWHGLCQCFGGTLYSHGAGRLPGQQLYSDVAPAVGEVVHSVRAVQRAWAVIPAMQARG